MNIERRVKDDELSQAHRSSRVSGRRAFTLIEIMVVVAIIGIVAAMGMPAIYRVVKKREMQSAISDIEQVCNEARRQAIMSGAMAQVVIDAYGNMSTRAGDSHAQADGEASIAEHVGARSGKTTARLSEDIAYEMIRVDGLDYMATEETGEARIRFFPNGICDDMRIILRSVQNERWGIQTEITTGLTTVVTDARELQEWLQ